MAVAAKRITCFTGTEWGYYGTVEWLHWERGLATVGEGPGYIGFRMRCPLTGFLLAIFVSLVLVFPSLFASILH